MKLRRPSGDRHGNRTRGRFNFLLDGLWQGWRCWLVWAVCLCTIFILGAISIATDADFTFASLGILPVLAMAWIGGARNGFLMAFFAAAMWIVIDLVSDRQFSTLWIPWSNAVSRLMTYSLVAFLVAQVRLQLNREHEYASHDALTGLENRRAFLVGGTAEVQRSKRYAHPLALIYLDLDDFKQLNDNKGHAVGDIALQAAAKALVGALRSSDRVARLGGDEFAVLLPEIGYEAAIEAGRKIFAAVSLALKPFPPVKASFGQVWFEKAERSFPDMLKAADSLMYEVKESGKHDLRSRRFAADDESVAH